MASVCSALASANNNQDDSESESDSESEQEESDLESDNDPADQDAESVYDDESSEEVSFYHLSNYLILRESLCPCLHINIISVSFEVGIYYNL